jgi:squalene synthase HpnC
MEKSSAGCGEKTLAEAWSRLPEGYATPAEPPSVAEAEAWCSRLAHGHYENFTVASWFLPRHLHRHFYNIYAYCRVSDDLGDETGDVALSLLLLDEWQRQLDGLYEYLDGRGEAPRHPVFVALAATVREFGIPKLEFSDLLTAFREDQAKLRHENFESLLHYCHYSANPVGHLILYLSRSFDAERAQLSDYTCTALQLANFWQDLSVDWQKGRVYLPQEDLRRFGVEEQQIAGRRFTPEFQELMRFEVARAREWFARGLPLVKKLDGLVALDVELFSRGGLAILDAIEAQGFDVLSRRPAVSKGRKAALAMRAVLGRLKVGAR